MHEPIRHGSDPSQKRSQLPNSDELSKRYLNSLGKPSALIPSAASSAVSIDPNLPTTSNLYLDTDKNKRLENVSLHWEKVLIELPGGAMLVPVSTDVQSNLSEAISALDRTDLRALKDTDKRVHAVRVKEILYGKDSKIMWDIPEFEICAAVPIADVARHCAELGIKTKLALTSEANQYMQREGSHQYDAYRGPSILQFVDKAGALIATDTVLNRIAPAIYRERITAMVGRAEGVSFTPTKAHSTNGRLLGWGIFCPSIDDVIAKLKTWYEHQVLIQDDIDHERRRSEIALGREPWDTPFELLSGIDASYYRKIGKTPMQHLIDLIREEFEKNPTIEFEEDYKYGGGNTPLGGRKIKVTPHKGGGYKLQVYSGPGDENEITQFAEICGGSLIISKARIETVLEADEDGLIHIDPAQLFGLSNETSVKMLDRLEDGVETTLSDGRSCIVKLAFPDRYYAGVDRFRRTSPQILTAYSKYRKPGATHRVDLEIIPSDRVKGPMIGIAGAKSLLDFSEILRQCLGRAQ